MSGAAMNRNPLSLALGGALIALFFAGSVFAQDEADLPDAIGNATEQVGADPMACPVLLDEEGEPVLNEDGAPVLNLEAELPQLDDEGEPIVDEEGQPLMVACVAPDPLACPALTDEDGNPLTDEDGQTLYDLEAEFPELDENDEPVLDEDGEPVMLACTPPGEGLAEDLPEEADASGTVFTPLLRLLDAGGPIIVILAILAILVVGVALVKLIQFVWIGVGAFRFVGAAIETLKSKGHKSALDEISTRKNPVARVMAAAIRGKTNPDMDDVVVREEVTRVAQSQLDGLERGLVVLSLIATIAPLLGLLGTVLGMIEAFQQMETVGDRVEPAVLAGGIWEALLTTAAGLTVAIPAAVSFTWLQRSVDVEGQHMEDAATQVFTAPLYKAGPET
tara:strand:- start:135073 stop:136248 length:1176 start_codon:yes stop_codon:yes gene_type:complete